MTLKDKLAAISLPDLITFRDALTRYIEARAYQESEAGQVQQSPAEVRARLDDLQAELTAQTATTRALREQLRGSSGHAPRMEMMEAGSQVKPSLPPAQHNGHAPRLEMPERNRQYMGDLLGISPATLTRRIQIFAEFLSPEAGNRGHLFSLHDEEILLRVKALRDENIALEVIKEMLRANHDANRIA